MADGLPESALVIEGRGDGGERVVWGGGADGFPFVELGFIVGGIPGELGGETEVLVGIFAFVFSGVRAVGFGVTAAVGAGDGVEGGRFPPGDEVGVGVGMPAFPFPLPGVFAGQVCGATGLMTDGVHQAGGIDVDWFHW